MQSSSLEKQCLSERLQENTGSLEQEEIERLLEQINAASASLNEAEPGISKGLVPIDLADTDHLTKPAIAAAATLAKTWNAIG